MTTLADGGPRFPDRESRAAVILGNDAIVAARPVTPAQLMHACRAAGFDLVVPPSWGDELVAGAYLERLAGCTARVAVACNCARVRTLLEATPAQSLVPAVTIASPPIAAARYLRLVYGDSILVTYVGDCPSADDSSINARFSPSGFFASLDRQGIRLTAQPDVMTESESERWRRYRSVPGGLPARRWLARRPVERLLREVQPGDANVADWPAARRANVLLDLAQVASCACGGNRVSVEDSEPARSVTPIIVAPVGLDLSAAPRPAATPREPAQAIHSAPPASAAGAMKAAVPRPDGLESAKAHGIVRPEVAVRRTRPAPRIAATPAPARWSRAAMLATIPAVVLLGVAALGMAAYGLTSSGRAATATAGGESTPPARRAPAAAATLHEPADSLAKPPMTGPASERRATGADTARVATPFADSSRARADTARAASPRRPRRARAPEVVPGWLPQGGKTWTPRDTNRPVRPDSAVPRVRPDTVPRA
jgi:hypothetical protein